MDDKALAKFTLLAQDIIYHEDRMKQFLKMMSTPHGAVMAVHVVLQAINQKMPIPPQIAAHLGANIYLIMVDQAQQITGHKASPEIVGNVIKMIMAETDKAHPMPKGIIQGA